MRLLSIFVQYFDNYFLFSIFFFSRLSSHAGLIYFPFSNLVQQVTCTVVVFAMISFRNLHAARKGLIVLAISFGVILRSFIFFI